MKHFIYSDPHFSHANIIKYAERPFESVNEMNEYMISLFNSVVSQDDKVFILGDFGFASFEDMKIFIGRLNGYKVLIMGNHDRKKPRNWWLQAGFNEVHKDPILIRNQFILSHEPIEMSQDMPYLNIHGHIHQDNIDDGKHLNVSVEQIDYRPVKVDKLIRMHKKRISQQNHLEKPNLEA